MTRIARQSAIPLALYALSRVIDTFVLLRLQHRQTTDPTFLTGGVVPIQVQPRTYAHIITNWDGQWYRLIAEHGYPHTLPTYNGQVWQNQWAFYPGFPMLCRVLMHLGLSYEASAALISTVAGAVGCCLLYALVRTAGTRFTAAMAVVGICFFPAAVVLQAAYTESLAFALIVGALLALTRRRYGVFVVCTVALSLTRPVALPLAAVIGVHTLIRWLRRDKDPFPVRERLGAGAATAVAIASAGVWPLIAAAVTGHLNAYYQTELAWADNRQWRTWLGDAVGFGGQGVMTFTAVAVFVVIVIAAQRSAKAWPTELRVWSVAYVLYVLASTRVTPSITRYLMLAIVPWWPLPAVSERRMPPIAQIAIVAAAVVIGTELQIGWTGANFIVGDSYRGYP